MRNAATFDDDFGSAGASRRGVTRTRPSAAGNRKRKAAKRARPSLNGVARYAAIGMAALMASGIVVNALVLQKGHHPAPLFAKAPAPSPVPAKAVASAPAAPPRTTASENAPADIDTAPAKPRRIAGTAREIERGAAGDAIGRLIAGGGPRVERKTVASASGRTGGGTRSGETGDANSGNARTISEAQRALTKLGFKVPATGTAGPATRKAVEAFEKERHLPVRGTLDRKLVKVLASASGLKID